MWLLNLSDNNIDIPLILHIVINLLNIDIIKAKVPGSPSCWSNKVVVASLIPTPPGKPDKTPSIPDIKYMHIELEIEIVLLERT